jgi:uncharacterized repeat protein (TIGR03803 family)
MRLLSARPKDIRVGLRATITLIFFSVGAMVPSSAQTFTTRASFDGRNGNLPLGAMVQAVDGNFYGVTSMGGRLGDGVIYKLTPGGALTLQHEFCKIDNCPGGEYPAAGINLASNGDFYGTTTRGGAYPGGPDKGTVFKFTTDGAFHRLYSFCPETDCLDGQAPMSSLVQASDGNFYGTAAGGGAHDQGSIFKISPAGEFTTLYSFCPDKYCREGAYPNGGLIQAADGKLYGTTVWGGTPGLGTIFSLTTDGTLKIVYNFCSGPLGCTDGKNPGFNLVQGADGDFYGTTTLGGDFGDGVVFKVTPNGTYHRIYSFCAETNCTDGSQPWGELILANDGNLYGTTQRGGRTDRGTIFRVKPGGRLTVLYSFKISDGGFPAAALVQATDGNLYGTTGAGGFGSICGNWLGGGIGGGCGTVFRLSMGLDPFVKTLRSSGKIGSPVVIYGTDLTGTTGVTINGIAASFTVVSETEISATVPTGATSGEIEVVTPSATLSTVSDFRVWP